MLRNISSAFWNVCKVHYYKKDYDADIPYLFSSFNHFLCTQTRYYLGLIYVTFTGNLGDK